MAASSKPCVPAWLVNPTPVGNYSIFSVVGNFPYPFPEGRRYRRLVLGDYLIVECTYNTNDREEITHGGPNTQDEMCLGHILHYPKMKLRRCKSNPHRVAYLEALGATEVMFRAHKDDFVPIQPPQMAGKSMKKLLHSVSWNEELRQKFQQTLTMREPPPVILHPFEEADVCKTQANAENKSGTKKGSRRKTRKNHRKLNLSPWRHHRRARKISCFACCAYLERTKQEHTYHYPNQLHGGALYVSEPLTAAIRW
uniref:Copper type II ascorbate-dependent monooxygenase C-terminal domain-containing protein n=1 Tax=Branchiostoma floridae TaxID=7739 RepID=C3XVR0_BRAFL|eukprot:XP_002611844.1 hypothetical protein BRAFLDRAFT_83132 [Branchiostoma floridae]